MKKPSRALGPPTITRRQLLAGAAATAVALSVPSAVAKTPRLSKRKKLQTSARDLMIRRYFSASAILGDGRILIAGGYDQPWTDSSAPRPLGSAVIYDPATGTAVAAAPLKVPRGRHAAVALADGRVAMIGGMGMTPTTTIEIYDPATNTWRFGAALSQPRYDHNAVTDGSQIFVLGGSGQLLMSGVEALDPYAQGLEG